MSYSTSAKGKGLHYYQQQHPQHRLRFPQQQRQEEISPRQPRFNPQQAPRPQHPVPSQSPRVPSPSASPVAVTTLPHDMNKQGAPNRPGMAASPAGQQGILTNQPNPNPAAMINMNNVRYPGPPRGAVAPRYPHQVQQPVYNVRHPTPPMQGMQHHPQAGGPGAQQGASQAQLMQSGAAAAASSQYMQPGQPQYMLTGPMPIVQQLQRGPFQSYQQVYQPTTPPFYNSPPQSVWLTAPTQPTSRQQYTQSVPAARQDGSTRNKKILRIVDPTTNQDLTDAILRDASGSSSPHSGRSSANVTPPVSTSSEDAKRIQAQFAANVAMVASDIPDHPAQQHQPSPVPSQQMQQQQQGQPPVPLQQHQQPMAPQPMGQPPPMQQQPSVGIPQIVQVVPGQVPSVGGAFPMMNPGMVPTAAVVVPQGQLPSQPVDPSIPEAAPSGAVVAATPPGEAVQPPRPNVQAVPKPTPPMVVAAPEPAQLQQARPPVQQLPPGAHPVPVPAQLAQKPLPAAVPQVAPPARQQMAPAPTKDSAPAKQELPVASGIVDTAQPTVAAAVKPAAVPEKQVAPEASKLTAEAKPQPKVQQGDGGAKQAMSSANTPAVSQPEVSSAVPSVESQDSATPVESKDSKKKSQKKRMQELDKKGANDSDEFAAYRTEEVVQETAPAASKENSVKEGDATPAAPDNTLPKEQKETVQEKPTTQKAEPQPATTQPAEPAKKAGNKTDDSQGDVAKRKNEKDVASEKAVDAVVPETTAPKLDPSEEKENRNEADDREGVNEMDNVESENSKNREGKPNPKDNKIQLKYSYRDGQWSPANLEGKKQYDRDFLLQFQKGCTDKPDGLPNIPDIVLDKAVVTQTLSLNLGSNVNQKQSDFMPAFMKSPRVQGKQPNYPTGQGRRASREQKVIHRAASSMETKLNTSEKAWKPGHKRSQEGKDEATAKTEELFRNFTGILNKLTPTRFQKLVEQAQQLPIDNEERLKGVTQLVFEKAISEPSFSTAYAHMCQRLSQLKVPSTSNPNQDVLFRPILVQNCQREFEKEMQTEIDEKNKRKEIAALPADQRAAQLELLEEKLGKEKRRTMGNMRFIGELYKLRILTENIMHECVIKLLKAKDDDSLECLCNLMATIGKDLDHEKAKNRMDQYFVKVEKIIQSKKNPPRIRFLMADLLDLRKNNWVPRRQENKPQTIDAIHRDWHIKEAKKAEELKAYKGRSREQQLMPPPRTGPPQADDGWNTVPTSNKTRTVYDPSKLKLTRIAADDNIQLGPGGRSFNMWTRGSSGGTNKNQKESADSASASSQEDSTPQQANRFSMLSEDAKRPISRGSSGFGSRDSRGRGQSPISKRSSREREREKEAAIAEVHKLSRGRPSRSEQSSSVGRGSQEKISRPEKKEEPDMPVEKFKQKANAIVEEFINLRDLNEATTCVSELPSRQRELFVSATVEHVIEKKQDMREATGVLFQALIEKKLLTKEQYLAGFSGMIEFAEDMAIDIPKIYEYLGEIQGGMVAGATAGGEALQLQATAIKPLLEHEKAGVLLAEILRTAARRNGASKACHIWQQSSLRWEDFLPSGDDVQEFVKRKGVEFTLDGASTADNGLNSVEADSQGDWLKVINRGLTNLLREKPDVNAILDWIQHNVTEPQRKHNEFIRALVTIICQHTAEGEGQSCRIEPDNLKSLSPVLMRYIDSVPERELQALFAVQALNNSLQNPPGLLRIIFDLLYDEDVITENAFYEWKKSEDPRESAGKGVALKSVTSFFTWLAESE